MKKDIECIKKNQTEMKNILCKINVTLKGINRLYEAENQVSDFWRQSSRTQSEQQKEKQTEKGKDSLRAFWVNLKHTNIWIIGVPEKEEHEERIENLFQKIMPKNFPKLVKENDVHPESEEVPNKIIPKRLTQSKTHHN